MGSGASKGEPERHRSAPLEQSSAQPHPQLGLPRFGYSVLLTVQQALDGSQNLWAKMPFPSWVGMGAGGCTLGQNLS